MLGFVFSIPHYLFWGFLVLYFEIEMKIGWLEEISGEVAVENGVSRKRMREKVRS